MKAVIESTPSCIISGNLAGYRIAGAFKPDSGNQGSLGFGNDFIVQIVGSSRLPMAKTGENPTFPKSWDSAPPPAPGTTVTLTISTDNGIDHTFKKIDFLGANEVINFSATANKNRVAYWLLTFKYRSDVPAAGNVEVKTPANAAETGNVEVKTPANAAEDIKNEVFAVCKGGYGKNSKPLFGVSSGVHDQWYFADLHGLRSSAPDWMEMLLQADTANLLNVELNLNGSTVANLKLRNGLTAGNTVKLILAEEVWGAFHALEAAKPEDGHRYLTDAGVSAEVQNWLFRRPSFRDHSVKEQPGAHAITVVERVSIWASANAAEKLIALAESPEADDESAKSATA